MNLRHIFVCALMGTAATHSFAQPNRISSKIDKSHTFTLAGHVHPLATAAHDRGEVESGFALPGMTMTLHPTAAQQAKLQQLLQDQQNPKSSSYRQWLTPEQYADRFGVSAADAAQIVAWLEGQGFTVDPVSRSRTFITFGGTAGQVQQAFGTAIHRYQVNGQAHYANSTEPVLPAALSPLVSNIRGLHDFHPKAKIAKAKANWNLGRGQGNVLAPDDFATIYDITAMYNSGINGSGQKIAIVGQTTIVNSDITNFWSTFGITTAKLVTQQVPRQNPGRVQGDVDESALDLEWAGAVARGATVVFVYSFNVWDSAQYTVDNNLAPVISMSYGLCELFDLADLPSEQQLVQQANAEGITWLAAAGDQDATDCDGGSVVAEGGLAVDTPGSMPEVTSMGGTSLSSSSTYWNTTNTATDQSAKGYIPEIAWNESAFAGEILGTGGGASAFFPQPAWQTNGGVPKDGWRHVPDLAFNSSVYEVPYYVYCTACSDASGGQEYVGGTSAATPTMAGVVAMLNQSLKTNGLGNINPTIYNLYQTTPSAFHNNITGNNSVACAPGSPGCVNGQEGYSITGAGYNSVVGFGSVDVTKLIQSWSGAAPTGPTVAVSFDQNPVFQGNAESCGTASSWNFVVTLTEEAGFTTSITGLSINGADFSSKIASIFGTSAIPARQSIAGCLALSGVNAPGNEAFVFSGPNSSWSTSATISFQGPQSQLAISGATNAASYTQTYAPGMIMAVFGAGMGTLSQSASTIPLPEFMAGVEAVICPSNCNTATAVYPVPLYYAGPNQVNLQIPYEVSGAVDLNVATPYSPFGVDFFFTVSATAPGIFTFLDGSNDVNPSRTGKAGQASFLFITGEGKVSPSLPDGTTPAAGTPLSRLPKPIQAVTVTVGGVPVSTTDGNWFIGIPPGLVGVTQINFTIPSSVPAGRQPVVVTIGTTSTPAAYITVQ